MAVADLRTCTTDAASLACSLGCRRTVTCPTACSREGDTQNVFPGKTTHGIFVASSLPQRLDQPELNAVVAHEAAHVRRRDPLRLSTYRFLSCLFFWLPALKELAADMADEAEIEADDPAAETGPLALASALLNLAADPRGSLTAHSLVHFANRDLLDRRIRRFTGESTPLPSRVSRRSLVLASVALTFVLFSGMAAAAVHPHVRVRDTLIIANTITVTSGRTCGALPMIVTRA